MQTSMEKIKAPAPERARNACAIVEYIPPVVYNTFCSWERTRQAIKKYSECRDKTDPASRFLGEA